LVAYFKLVKELLIGHFIIVLWAAKFFSKKQQFYFVKFAFDLLTRQAGLGYISVALIKRASLTGNANSWGSRKGAPIFFANFC